MENNRELDQAFGAFSAKVRDLARKVNAACVVMRKAMTGTGFDTQGNTLTGGGRAMRDYENALEELKGFIENRSAGQVHNDNLKWPIGTDKHAIRALEVELVHPRVKAPGDLQGPNREGELIDEHIITGVVVRGFISIQPAGGNEEPSYSSKSSSSSVSR